MRDQVHKPCNKLKFRRDTGAIYFASLKTNNSCTHTRDSRRQREGALHSWTGVFHSASPLIFPSTDEVVSGSSTEVAVKQASHSNSGGGENDHGPLG